MHNMPTHATYSTLTEYSYSKVQDNCMLVVPVDVHSTQRYTGFGQAMADGVFGCGFFQMKVEKSLFRLSQLAV